MGAEAERGSGLRGKHVCCRRQCFGRGGADEEQGDACEGAWPDVRVDRGNDGVGVDRLHPRAVAVCQQLGLYTPMNFGQAIAPVRQLSRMAPVADMAVPVSVAMNQRYRLVRADVEGWQAYQLVPVFFNLTTDRDRVVAAEARRSILSKRMTVPRYSAKDAERDQVRWDAEEWVVDTSLSTKPIRMAEESSFIPLEGTAGRGMERVP